MKKEKSTLKVLNYSSISFFCLMIFFGYGGGEAVADILGDVNGDVTVNSTDALIILSCDVGMDTAGFCPMNCGDVNADGMVNSTDALIVLSNDVGISVPFPIGEPECPSSVTPCPGCTVTARPPNILLIIADDVGMDVTTDMYPGLIDDLSNLYNNHVPPHPDAGLITGRPASTPVLDQLAQEGKVFSNTWAQPFCSPTRASIITGLFAAKHNVTTYLDPLSQNHATFVQKLKDEANYSTAAFGKWHLAGLGGYTGMKPKEAGFELYKGGFHAAPQTYWGPYEYFVQDGDTAADEWRTENPPQKSLPGISPTTYLPVVKAADTIEWINQKEAQDPDKPWLAWLAFNLAHGVGGSPLMVVPDEDTLDGPSHLEMEQCGGTFGSNSVGLCTGEELMRAMTNSMDTVIGKLLEAVDSIPSDTYVIYIGDNGTPMYNLHLGSQIDNMYITREGRGKGSAYESGARVAMAIRGPGIAAGSRSDEFVHAADLHSTILEIAGLTPPENVPDSTGTGTVPLDAVSLSPILFDSASAVRHPIDGYILTESQNLMQGANSIVVGARNATYKVVCKDGTGTSDCEFYHLATDPLEEYPLSKPGDCADYSSGLWTPEANPEWHYCRLIEVIDQYSIFP